MNVTKLFGGAIEALIPAHFQDASQFRQIPDNQEVFVAGDSDDSVIIELLEPASMDDHIQEVLDLNEAQSAEFLERSDIVIAKLNCAKFNQRSAVTISMGRKHSHDCDILVTMNSDKPHKQLLLQILESIIVKDPSLFA
jgi:hypothetical protein